MDRDQNYAMVYQMVYRLIEQVINDETSEKYCQFIDKHKLRFFNKTFEKLNLEFINNDYFNNFYQPRIYQQYTYNLCGYHVLFTVLNLVNFYQSGFTKYLQNIVQGNNFWKFHSRIRKYLKDFSIKNDLAKYGQTWQLDWCGKHGDLERNHLKAIILENEEFLSCFKPNRNFWIAQHTFNYQGGIILNKFEELSQIQRSIDYLISNQDENRSKVVVLFLAICNHWVGFVVHKNIKNIEYIYIDSRNHNYLVWDHEQIMAYIEERDKSYQKRNKKPMPQFFKDVHYQCIVDIRFTLKFLFSVISKQQNIIQYYFDVYFKKRMEEKIDPILQVMTTYKKQKRYQNIFDLLYENFAKFEKFLQICLFLQKEKKYLTKDSLCYLKKLKKHKNLLDFIEIQIVRYFWSSRLLPGIKGLKILIDQFYLQYKLYISYFNFFAHFSCMNNSIHGNFQQSFFNSRKQVKIFLSIQ